MEKVEGGRPSGEVEKYGLGPSTTVTSKIPRNQPQCKEGCGDE